MRTILFVTQSNSSAALAKRIQDSGDRVIIEENLFEGSLFNPEVLKRSVRENPELVIMDANFEAGQSAKIEFEKAGIPVYGSSMLSRSAVNNGEYISKVLNHNGVKTTDIPETATALTYSVILNGREKICSCIFFEYEHLMNDNKGPKAFMGSIGYYGDIPEIESKMGPMVNALIMSGFSGKVDFHLKLKNDIWCDGIHFYFSWNTIYNLLENINLSPSELFCRLSLSQELKIKFHDKWSCQINCAVPPFPYELSKKHVTKISGIDGNNGKHLWVTNFKSGELLCATGHGKYVREAKRRAYRSLSNVSAEDIMYRTDIGLETVDTCKRLRNEGWLQIKDDELLEPYKKALA